MSTALVIGLGMGQQYTQWLKELHYRVFTVDIDSTKTPDYTTVFEAKEKHGDFDLVYIGVPNWLHEPVAKDIANNAKLVLIEKPGVKNSESWADLINQFPATRIMMIKNNQYRNTIKDYKNLVSKSSTVHIVWNNRNRIPNPGSWFTDKSKSFGGVSRDLMPHILSYYCALTNYQESIELSRNIEQQHKLKDIISTDYGFINHNGIYDVDDLCELSYLNDGIIWKLDTNWKTNEDDDVSIRFETNDGIIKHQLGLCPKEAYQLMIVTAIENLNNNEFWQYQLNQDIWIHRQIENL